MIGAKVDKGKLLFWFLRMPEGTVLEAGTSGENPIQGHSAHVGPKLEVIKGWLHGQLATLPS